MGVGQNLSVKWENIFKSAYLFLLIDQHEDGLWGKSIPSEAKRRYSHEREIQSKKSIVVTFQAIDSIYTFTKSYENYAIQRTLKYLPKFRDNSGYYGVVEAPIKIYPKSEYRLIPNNKSTAAGLLIRFLLQQSDEEDNKTLKFLVDSQSKDGGWATSKEMDSECVTTSYVLKALTLAKERQKKLLSEELLRRVDDALKTGLDWLEKDIKANGFWDYPKEYSEVYYSAGVLTIFPELRNYRKELYSEILFRIASLQNEDGGWPLSIRRSSGRESKMTSTIVAVNALISSNENKYRQQIENGMTFIMSNLNSLNMKRFYGIHWALLLKLAKYENFNISLQDDHELQKIANEISEKINRSDREGFLQILENLRESFQIIREPLSDLFESYREYLTEVLFPLKNAILVLGSYTPLPDIKKLEELRDYLRNKGHTAYLARDLPDFTKRIDEKEIVCIQQAKFSVWLYEAASWAISEFEYAKQHRLTLVILTPKGGAGSKLREQLEFPRIEWIKVFEYERSPFEVIDLAVKWAEKFVENQRKLRKT